MRPDRLLNTREIAARLGVSQASAWRMLRLGQIRSVVVVPGKKVRRRALESEVEALRDLTRSDVDHQARVKFIRKRQAGDLYGDLLRARKAAGLTTEELAGIAGLSRITATWAQQPSQWKRCSVAALERLADVLGYGVRWALVRKAGRAGIRASRRHVDTPQSDHREAQLLEVYPGSGSGSRA